MAIPIKNSEQIIKMKRAGELVAKTHEIIEKYIKAGVTTLELDNLADDFIKSNGGIPSFKGYRGFPRSICASVNEVVIHGIPDKTRLKDGDLLSVDLGAIVDGYHGDAARSYLVGECSADAARLVEVTRQSFFAGIEYAKIGNHLLEISAAIQDFAEGEGYSVVREYVGHGIGKVMHEPPEIPNYKPQKGGRGPKIMKGMTFAIEPMVNAGTHEIDILADGWSVVTKDGRLSAHYENTILITDGKPEILTMR